jgi:hypothetical protein
MRIGSHDLRVEEWMDWVLIGDWCRAKPKSLFAKTSAKNLAAGGAMFGDKIPGGGEDKTMGGQ